MKRSLLSLALISLWGTAHAQLEFDRTLSAPEGSPVVIDGDYECFNCGTPSMDWKRLRNVAFNCGVYQGDGLDNHCTTAFNTLYNQATKPSDRGIQVRICSNIMEEPFCQNVVIKLKLGPLLTVSIPWIQNGIPILSQVTGIKVSFTDEIGDPHNTTYEETQTRLPEDLPYPPGHPFNIDEPIITRFWMECPGLYDLTWEPTDYNVRVWRERDGSPDILVYDGPGYGKALIEVPESGYWMGKIVNYTDDPAFSDEVSFGPMVGGSGHCNGPVGKITPSEAMED